MQKKTLIAFISALALSVAYASQALADVAPPPDSETCEYKDPGDSCRVGGERGECVISTCTRPATDEQGNPITEEYECLECIENADGGCSVSDRRASATVPVVFLLLVATLFLFLRRRS